MEHCNIPKGRYKLEYQRERKGGNQFIVVYKPGLGPTARAEKLSVWKPSSGWAVQISIWNTMSAMSETEVLSFLSEGS